MAVNDFRKVDELIKNGDEKLEKHEELLREAFKKIEEQEELIKKLLSNNQQPTSNDIQEIKELSKKIGRMTTQQIQIN